MTSLLTFRGRSAFRLAAGALAAAILLSACGGGGGGGGGAVSGGGSTATTPTPPVTTRTPDAIPSDYQSYANLCAAPRSGVDAFGTAFPDKQGTLLDEMKFLRGWADRYYLWYNEIPNDFYMADFSNTLDYFAKLKTPALTASGKAKDQFHFTYTTAEWDALSTSGQEVGYGLTWSRSSTTAPAPAST